MTFPEALRSHRGGLVRIKTQLYWYGGRGWDGTPGRVCLLLDSAGVSFPATNTPRAKAVVLAATTAAAAALVAATALLLVDGQPHWIWVGADDVELL